MIGLLTRALAPSMPTRLYEPSLVASSSMRALGEALWQTARGFSNGPPSTAAALLIVAVSLGMTLGGVGFFVGGLVGLVKHVKRLRAFREEEFYRRSPAGGLGFKTFGGAEAHRMRRSALGMEGCMVAVGIMGGPCMVLFGLFFLYVGIAAMGD